MLLQTQEIRLVPVDASHKDIFIALANIPEINHRVNKPFPYLETHFDELLNKKTAFVHHTWMIEKAGSIAGVINTAAARHTKVFQGGYWIHPDYWGKNIATDAVLLMRDFLFERYSAIRAQAVVEPDNTASMRVLEKCGYIREGMLRKFYPSMTRDLLDVYMYAYVRG
ncbi:MAG: GNAT family N-acetyltransferase [Candidatus Sungbacteria bacterium]|uniref:GNAT family N-acetyltransferase n=1 Tax=Candidatus Sungiibacteriota bacterium TaxID=2750080 RepID=A0A932QZR6_9BACT|nr:GNAT family N-acetyltransferase [Candidatus Sungbacteria bacterium]